MKKIVILCTLLLTLSAMPSATATQILIEGYATIDYPTKVKLGKSGCQNIPFKYVTDELLPRENTVFTIAITPKGSKRVYGIAAWFSTQTSAGEKALPPMSRIGVLQVKVCRKAFWYSPTATKLTLASKPGKYRLFFNAGSTDPVTGSLIGEKIEIIREIEFH